MRGFHVGAAEAVDEVLGRDLAEVFGLLGFAWGYKSLGKWGFRRSKHVKIINSKRIHFSDTIIVFIIFIAPTLVILISHIFSNLMMRFILKS